MGRAEPGSERALDFTTSGESETVVRRPRPETYVADIAEARYGCCQQATVGCRLFCYLAALSLCIFLAHVLRIMGYRRGYRVLQGAPLGKQSVFMPSQAAKQKRIALHGPSGWVLRSGPLGMLNFPLDLITAVLFRSLEEDWGNKQHSRGTGVGLFKACWHRVGGI